MSRSGRSFAIQPAQTDGMATFLRDGRDLLAAGYFIYGPQTALVATFGAGCALHPRPRDRRFHRGAAAPGPCPPSPANSRSTRRTTATGRSRCAPISTTASPGPKGPRGKDFNMRWVASLVAETHRIMTRGGIFLYPGDERGPATNGPPAAGL
jgi:fructose-1,6-bisphosphatase I